MKPDKEFQRINRRFEKANRTAREIRDGLDLFINEIDKIKADTHELQLLNYRKSYPGLNFITLRNALCTKHKIEEQTWVPKFLSTIGAGPWESSEFDEFLRSYGFVLYSMPHQEIECVVAGAFDWDEGTLSEQIYDRHADKLKIYTQELFVLGLIVGQDPYEFLEQDAIDEIGNAHSAIQFILEREFAWPSWPTSNEGGLSIEDKFIGVDWAKESVLMAMGYSVKAKGPDKNERQNILRRAFEQDFPRGLVTFEQRKRWGAKKSADRLYAISHFLSWLIGFQGAGKPAAKAKWASDLDWLKLKYYSRTMKFGWPTSDIQASAKSLSPRSALPSSSTGLPKSSGDDGNTKVRPELDRKRPSHALSKIVDDMPLTFQEALSKLKNYINREKLTSDGVNVRCDQPLFALSGVVNLKMDDLENLVSRNLR